MARKRRRRAAQKVKRARTKRQSRWATALRLLLLGVGLSPWLVALLGQSDDLRAVFFPFCHQLPARSLTLGAAVQGAMVVCSRCAGIYLGVALGALVAMPRAWVRHGRTLVFIALMLNLMQASGRWLGFYAVVHGLRVSAGLLLGWSVTAFVVRSTQGASEAVAGTKQ